MFAKPNYETLRQETGFHWSVGSIYLALLEVTGVPIRDFYLSPEACIEVYRKGRPRIREMFGEDVGLPGVSTPPISYGHANGLGANLIFPEGGEVAHEHPYSSLEEAIGRLEKSVEFATSGMAPFYLDFRATLQAAFPDEPIGFGFGLEGPITTAYELRGEGFFYDLMDQPAKTKQFLELTTRSIIEFHRFRCKVLDQPEINPEGGGMCDDIASMIPPGMFAEYVLPYWDQYFNGMTTGRRHAHVEDLRPDHLEFLERIALWNYDPSISPKLNPKIISRNCRVPFAWRLGSFHYPSMSCRDIQDFVFQAVADGAGRVFSLVSATMCNDTVVQKVKAFVEAASEAKRMFDGGVSRENIRKNVSPEGKKKFWDEWPEPS